jgi:hypothetical protein
LNANLGVKVYTRELPRLEVAPFGGGTTELHREQDADPRRGAARAHVPAAHGHRQGDGDELMRVRVNDNTQVHYEGKVDGG